MPSGANSHDLASSGSNCCVPLSYLTSDVLISLVMSIDEVSFAINGVERLGIDRHAEHEAPAVPSDRRHLPDQRLFGPRDGILVAGGLGDRSAAAGQHRTVAQSTPTDHQARARHFTYTLSMFQISRCAMMLGCALPNRLLMGIFTFSVGSQTVQTCSFQMF